MSGFLRKRFEKQRAPLSTGEEASLCWKQSALPVSESLGMNRRKKVWWNKSLWHRSNSQTLIRHKSVINRSRDLCQEDIISFLILLMKR
ncbi:MAG: hypothetical protein NVS3B14_04090 [Ktedonobacteraceae bacterium]